MPLPADGSFPLTGYSRPGEAATSRPKQAMIVRLSPETLDALQAFQDSSDAQPMSFTFGDNPCITINGESFPLNTGPTDKWHDIYLHSSSTGRRNPPFKLYANVVGRYAVQRQLDTVGERVREKMNEAETERASRTTIMLDTPPADVAAPKIKKKKDPPAMFRKPIAPSSKPEAIAAPASLPPEKLKDIRKRLVHCLASGDRTEEAAVKAVSNSPTLRLKQAILQVLDDVAVLVSKSDKTYRLKPQSWKEIKPFEMGSWSEAEKKRIAAEGRSKLKELRVPQSDPAWDNLTPPRPTVPENELMTPSTSTSGSQVSSALKRPPPDRDSAEPTAKRPTPNVRRDRDKESDRERQPLPAKPVAKSEYDGDRPKASSSRAQERDRERETNRARERAREARERDRESQREKDRPRDKARDRERDRDREPDRDRDRGRDGKKDRDRVRDDARDRDRGKDRERDRDRERDSLKPSTSSSGHSKRPSVAKTESAGSGPPRRANDSPLLPPPPPREPSGLKSTSRPIQRSKARGDESTVESDFERRPKHKTDRDPIQRLSRKDKEDGEYSDSSASGSSRGKRKLDDRGSPDARELKKQRTGPGSSNLKPKVEESDAELLRPKRMREAGASSSSAIKREHSPLIPPPRDTHRNRPNSPLPKRPSTLPEKPQVKRESSFMSNDSSSKTGRHSSKQPRRQPIYTSSEDEGDELPQPSSKARSQQAASSSSRTLPPRPFSPLPSKPTHLEVPGKNTDSNVSVNGSNSSRPIKPQPRKPPSKQEMKMEYNKKYSVYIGGLAKLTSERAKLEAMMAKLDGRGSASLSDSEGEIMPPDQIAKLVADHKHRHGELQAIYKTVESARLRASTSGSGGSSD